MRVVGKTTVIPSKFFPGGKIKMVLTSFAHSAHRSSHSLTVECSLCCTAVVWNPSAWSWNCPNCRERFGWAKMSRTSEIDITNGINKFWEERLILWIGEWLDSEDEISIKVSFDSEKGASK